MTPDVVYDQLIGMGMARSWSSPTAATPGVGSLHRFRDAVEHGWPRPLRLDEHSHAGMANRYVAGASRLPFGVLRGYAAPTWSRPRRSPPIACPFTGEELIAVRGPAPRFTVIHAQQADRRGNVMLWGIVGVQKEAVLAARAGHGHGRGAGRRARAAPRGDRAPRLDGERDQRRPGWRPPLLRGRLPTRDNDFYRAWDEISRDRDRFTAWIEEEVRGV